MALIKCPECGGEVSSSALSCPRCGFPLANGTKAAIAEAIDRGNHYLLMGPRYAELAILEYKKAADLGDRDAMYGIGIVYRRIKDRDEKYADVYEEYNNQEAAKWFKKAAELGQVKAMNELAFMYSMGYGVEEDPQQATEWYRKAAELGDAYAQCMLGSRYERGAGVPADISEARKWYQIAAQNGHESAKKQLERLDNK